MSAPRYAIYFAPEADSPLWRFGSRAIGYDAATGEELRLDAPAGLTEDLWVAATAEARRYGFHATLKAPFRLAEGVTEADLFQAFDDFGATQPSVGPLNLDATILKSFIALTPEEASQPLLDLAAEAVRRFESLRAPLEAGELARRLESPLTPRQREYLDAFGYPYVFDEFRFHMTLTGPLHFELREAVLAELRARRRREVGSRATRINRIAIFRQAFYADRFRIIRAATLR